MMITQNSIDQVRRDTSGLVKLKHNCPLRLPPTACYLLLFLILTACLPLDSETADLLLNPQPEGDSSPSTASATTSATLTPAEIFAGVSPSIVYVETPGGATGSGVLIEDGYIVTNAHVVWPFEAVRIVFPDGTEHLDAPVLNWDLMIDLAIVGPLETENIPLAFGNGEDLSIGSDVYLIGYPGEPDSFPQPTLVRGLLSRLREWEATGITYFQSDAPIAGGQSGGVLVSQHGEIIGITTFFFTEAGYAVASSTSDTQPRIESLLADKDPAGLGKRRLPRRGQDYEHQGKLAHARDTQTFVIEADPGTMIDLVAWGEFDIGFEVFDSGGYPVLLADNLYGGVEAGSFTVEHAVPYFVTVWQHADEVGRYWVESSEQMTPYRDADDGQPLAIGNTVRGNIDHPGDLDHFTIQLNEGDIIELQLESFGIDAFVSLDFAGATDEEVVSDNDSGGGLFGSDAWLTFEAPHPGEYFIVVDDLMEVSGGYILSINALATEAPARATTDPQEISSPLGSMRRYESNVSPHFSIQYSADWVAQPPGYAEIARFVQPRRGGSFSIIEEDLIAAGLGELTLAAYVDLTLDILQADLRGFELVSQTPIETEQGLQAVILTFTERGGVFTSTRLIYLHPDHIAFHATYFATTQRHKALQRLSDYSFGTFHVLD